MTEHLSLSNINVINYLRFFGLPRKLRLLAMTEEADLPIIDAVDSSRF
jgi:hypothetical protein